MITRSDLPDDIETLKAMLVAKDELIAVKDELINTKDKTILTKDDRIVRLEGLLAAFKQALFGRKSEKLDPDQFDLSLEDIETAIATVIAEDEADPHTSAIKDPHKRKINRGSLPEHLPRIEEVLEPETTVCACGCALHVIGEDVSERLDIIPAQFQVIVTRRPKYACRLCEEGIHQALAPSHLILGGIPTEATIAHVLVSKYADHLPLYRQSQIYARQGIDLDRSTLADWVGRAAFELKPVFECLMVQLKQSSKLFMDETRAPVLDPGRRKTKTGYFWALAREDAPWGGEDPPGVAFTYAPGRSGQYAETILKGFKGTLQVDGYAGYNRLLKRREGPIMLAYCWVHARRKLYEISKNGTAPIAEEGLSRITALYRIEADIRGQSASARLAIRQAQAAPLIAEFKQWLTQNRNRVSRKSPLGEALAYIAKYWEGLTLYLTDGQIEMDNNAVERTIRPITLNRKNALFAGHDTGAQNWAMIASLIETAKLNKIEPHAYLTKTLTAIANGHKQSDIEMLLPWNHHS